MGLTVRFLSPRSVCLHTTCPALCPTSEKYPNQYEASSEVLISHLTHGLQLSTNLISFFDKEDKHRRMDFGILKNCLDFFFNGSLNQAGVREKKIKPIFLFLLSTGSFSPNESPSPQYRTSILWIHPLSHHNSIKMLYPNAGKIKL